ncbi:MAG TPA: GH116 family glycosyl-hydrolase [Edaphobacter sp.]|nr:GH116 family glycosyl-hydrolase [Edaphobacter sp.]
MISLVRRSIEVPSAFTNMNRYMANQFAMFQQSEGDAHGTATRVLMNGHPAGKELSSWQWDYPVGTGELLRTVSQAWFDYRWDKFPAHVVLEQFSPVIPDNYRESSYPVAVYRWHADNPTNKTVTVSVLLSWTNMAGWFRTFTLDMPACKVAAIGSRKCSRAEATDRNLPIAVVNVSGDARNSGIAEGKS